MAPVRGVDTMGGGGAAANGRPIPIRVSISYRKVPKLRYFAPISAALSLYSRDAYFPICVVDIARFAWWTPGSKVCAKTSDEQGTTTLRLAAIPGPDLWAAVAVTAGTRPRWSLTRQRHSATDLFSPHLHEEDTARNGTCLRVPSFRITDQIIGYVSL
ncbi:hypothetical protein Pst134EA_019627 [Puccinia striiformis f. sp. tritici]|nr:hypothetical protein Pst134EA_019627 [Puccinia striiformis f. sp. tritici]KAH9459474.1 hypothetical protein Pst134EA_019627 [Puccinia striiformis f. sp. tritici]